MKKSTVIQKTLKNAIFMPLFICVFTIIFSVNAMAASKTASLTNNKWYTDNSRDYYQTVYHKIKVPKTGYLTVSGYSYSSYSNSKYSLSVRLCNSKKREMQQANSLLLSSKGYKTYYAVKKGTYYIKVQSNKYKLKYSFKSMSDNGGSKASKAKYISKNKTAKGLILAGEKSNKVDWYKIVLNKPQKIKFTYGARANDWVQFKVSAADPRVSIYGASAYRVNNTQSFKTSSVFPAGTYYIQVYRMSNSPNCMGYYTVKWN